MSTRKPVVACAAALSLTAGLALAGSPVWSTELGDPGFSGSNVVAFEAHDDGTGEALYATGAFTIAGNPNANSIAKWDGSAWTNLGTGLQNQFSNTIRSFRGDLIVGGFFDTAGNVPGTAKLARWDGTNWNSMDARAEIFLSSMWDLEVHDDGTGEQLYIAGNYIDLNGQVGLDHIARWDGSVYTPVGGTITGAVPLIVLDVLSTDIGDGPALYAAGRFLAIDGVPANNIAKWTGSEWVALGNGLTRTTGFAQGFHMTTFDDGTGTALYVGGSFNLINGSDSVANVAKWDGTTWTGVGAGFNSAVQELTVFDDGTGEALYAMGNFATSGATPVSRIAKWNGTSWEPVGEGVQGTGNIFGAIVYDIGDGPALHMGGSFSTVDAQTANRVISLQSEATCPADLAAPFGTLNFFDVTGFLALFNAGDPAADFGAPSGVLNFFDVTAFLAAFNAGCP